MAGETKAQSGQPQLQKRPWTGFQLTPKEHRDTAALLRGKEPDDQRSMQLAKVHDVHPNQLTDWKNQLLKGAANVFGAEPVEAPVDLKELHAKIGQQSLEIDFLSGALTRVGLLSAKK